MRAHTAQVFNPLPVPNQLEAVTVRDRVFRLIRPLDPAGLCDDEAVQRRFDADEYMPYWAELWPAALLLASYLLDHPPEVEAAGALEIGCGLGLVGLAAAVAGFEVLATDYDADAVRTATRSAELTGVRGFRAAVMDWRRPALGRRFDRIFAADVLYERRWHGPIARLVAGCLTHNGEALICDPGRAVAAGFTDQARIAGLTVQDDPVTGHDETGKPIRGVLYRLTHA
jgi:predicted nicotinamide N-methyase